MSTGREEQEAAKKKKSLTQATLAFGSLQLAHGQPTVLSAPANQEVVAAAAAAATEAAQAVVEASLPGSQHASKKRKALIRTIADPKKSRATTSCPRATSTRARSRMRKRRRARRRQTRSRRSRSRRALRRDRDRGAGGSGCRVVAIFCMQLLVFGDHDRIEHVGPLVGHGYWA